VTVQSKDQQQKNTKKQYNILFVMTTPRHKPSCYGGIVGHALINLSCYRRLHIYHISKNYFYHKT